MLHYEKSESHHSKKDLVIIETCDSHGQVHVTRGQGLRGSSIWDGINNVTQIKTWLETPDKVVVWEMNPRQRQSIEWVVRLRDWSYPHCTVVQWEGNPDDGRYLFVSKPKSESVTVTDSSPTRTIKSKAKCKRKASKIRWP